MNLTLSKSNLYASEVTADLFCLVENWELIRRGLKDFMKIGKYVHQSASGATRGPVGASWWAADGDLRRAFQQNLIKLSFMVFRSLRRCFVFLVKLCLARQTISFCKPPNFKNGINQFKNSPASTNFLASDHTARQRLRSFESQQAWSKMLWFWNIEKNTSNVLGMCWWKIWQIESTFLSAAVFWRHKEFQYSIFDGKKHHGLNNSLILENCWELCLEMESLLIYFVTHY